LIRSHRSALLAAAVAAICAGIVFGILSRSDDRPEIAGFVYPEPKAIPPFKLLEHDGSPFDLEALKGKWSFVYFGYTYCPDACPTTLAELGRAQKSLEDAGLDAGNRYFFVSVDAQRDTPRRLAEYVAFFNKKFIGVTGADEALARFTQQAGVVYSFPEGRKGKNYAVDHSSTIALFDPDAHLAAVFTSPHKAAEIVDGFLKISRRRP